MTFAAEDQMEGQGNMRKILLCVLFDIGVTAVGSPCG